VRNEEEESGCEGHDEDSKRHPETGSKVCVLNGSKMSHLATYVEVEGDVDSHEDESHECAEPGNKGRDDVMASITEDGGDEEEASGDSAHDKAPSPTLGDSLGDTVRSTFDCIRVCQSSAITKPAIAQSVLAVSPYTKSDLIYSARSRCTSSSSIEVRAHVVKRSDVGCADRYEQTEQKSDGNDD